MKVFPAIVLFASIILASCNNQPPYQFLPGDYQSHTKWNGNDIKINLVSDSTFKFTAFNDRGLTYCSTGKWSVQDSFLTLKSYDAGKQYDFNKIFPELNGRPNVVALQIDGKFIIRGEQLYNLDPKTMKANEQEYYDRKP